MTSSAPNLQSLVDSVIAEVPNLAHHLREATHDEVNARAQYFPVLELWRRLRPRFEAAFESALMPLLALAREGKDPLARTPSTSLSLSLVDESQALEDVAIAHVIQAIEDECRTDVHQLGNFFAALRGTARARENDNPLRPALFARALFLTFRSAVEDPQGRYLLMQAASRPISKGLALIYGGLCSELRRAELSQLIASHAAHNKTSGDHMRLAQARLQTAPMPLDEPPATTRSAPLAEPDMLNRLYDEILADADLSEPLKLLLARLRGAVMRLARLDGSLLHDRNHPAWELLNRIASHAGRLGPADTQVAQDFLAFIDEQVQYLLDSPLQTAAQFARVLQRVDDYIDRQVQTRSERSAAALAALEREQARGQWQDLIGEQITAQIGSTPMSRLLRNFLQTTWVEVIVQAMVLEGRDSASAHAHIELVDELLESLHPARSPVEIDRLRRRLPGIANGLMAGFDSLAIPDAQREPILNDLMVMHTRVLHGQPAVDPQATGSRKPARVHDTVRDELDDGLPDDLSVSELLKRLRGDEDSRVIEQLTHSPVDRGRLPTVPAHLYSEQDSPEAQAAVQAWIGRLRVGHWCHLFLQGDWLTAQIAWISESGHYFLFVSPDAEARHSLTRGALERLLPAGLITELGDDRIVDRAADMLRQNRSDAP
ncbi:MAG: DUF1631 family protein [Paucibacter sp.]|nr:DUF1631 family protein [Roseateles sp.]